MSKTHGRFTLPGESGYEALTLETAKKWGADVIRDSDGTELSSEITEAGYGIYSTICIIRDHNEWAKENLDKLQQTFLMTSPVTATESRVCINLLEGFFEEQFKINDSAASVKHWQVFDRTANTEVKEWSYENGCVTVENAHLFHKYTVNFLAYRIWEEISMYNHITNNWDKEHLMQIDPIYPETQRYMLDWMTNWCINHPSTTVVRFTSMFYNFVWIFGSNERHRNLYTDWASYDFTVSPYALELFAEKFGFEMTSEDFINKGNLHSNHMPPDAKKKAWMKFVNDFTVDFGKQLVEIVHSFGKKAYVFYDDSWVGIEPWGERFGEFGFDGLIKCVFNGYEARLCAGVKSVQTHEIRLHPYLFPVGLGGLPTFSEGGNPTLDAKMYWKNVRRALLREKIDRIGLGGYLSLTLPFADFRDYIEELADDFREICSFHEEGKPYGINKKIYVLTAWGRLRSWTCSGHFHECKGVDLINVIESLAGLPFDVEFISLDDIKTGGVPTDADVIINAGAAYSAWSGGEEWSIDCIADKITEWTYNGGVFIGVNEPSAINGYDTYFRTAHILGIDCDTGAKISHGRFSFEEEKPREIVDGTKIPLKKNLYLTDEYTRVLLAQGDTPLITTHPFGKGVGIYLAGFEYNAINTKTLFNLILTGTGESLNQKYVADNPFTECCYFPSSGKLIAINNSSDVQSTRIDTDFGLKEISIEPYGMKICSVNN